MHWFWRSPNLRARRPERRRPATATPPRDGAQVRAAPASSEQYLDPAVAGRRLRPPSTEKSSEGSTTRRIRQAQREPPALLHTALPSWGASRGGEAVTWAAPLRSFAQCADICCWPPAPPQRVPSTGHRCARLHTPLSRRFRLRCSCECPATLSHCAPGPAAPAQACAPPCSLHHISDIVREPLRSAAPAPAPPPGPLRSLLTSNSTRGRRSNSPRPR